MASSKKYHRTMKLITDVGQLVGSNSELFGTDHIFDRF